MSNNTEINFPSERIFNRTETKGLNLSEIEGKNAIGPDETGTKDVFISWLESNENVKYFEYSDFKNLKSIGKGSYGSVFCANWRNSDKVFALKSFNNDETTLHQIINELKLHLNINHENILRFCGYTKIETDIVYQMSKYVLVLEYADSGTLNTYLKKHINELNWNDKLNLALQLANAVSHLHDNNVLHRDLHANNILIHKKKIKLADFGLSKKIAQQSSNTSRILGVVPYTDPKSFMNENYKLNKKSDVYSVGVLLWQISSGYEPFKDKGFDYDLRLVISINNGLREKSVDGTPKEYTKLYSECWNYEPDERPDMHQVVTVLRELYNNKSNVIYNVNKKKKSYLLKNNNSFNNFNGYNISLVSINTSLNIDQNESFIIEYENNLTSTVVDKLINYVIKKHDLGSTFNQIQQFIGQQTLKAPDNFVGWLSKNQNKMQYVWLLGLFYYYNIDTPDTEESKAFKLFSRASDENFPLAQVYLGKCYYDGYETEQNKYKAFIQYEKSVKNGSVLGQFYLGYCYEFGIGTEKNERKSVHWYKKAVDNGNTTAKLYLAYCYRFGKGVEKDEIQAFKYYKTLAKKDKIADAQQQLGNCYYFGIGTDIDKEKTYYWYKKAINNGNIIAKKCYKDYNIKTKKNINTNRINHYVILFFKNLRQLSLYYIGEILLIMNFKKAFYYFQKAAGKGNKHAQYKLSNFYKNGEYVKKNVRKAFELCQKSAKQGYKHAQFQLGYYYDDGIGVDINKANAFELYNLAAENGHNIAQNNLGILYLKGEGIEKNLKLAFNWFQEAANNGETSAQYNLGLCYELGLGVGENVVKAFGLYKKSAANGNINAKFQLGYCYVNGIGTEIDREKGFELYNKAAGKKNNYTQIINNEKVNYLDKVCDLYYKENDAKALYNLGLCYEFGQGVYQNEIMAFEFYKKSAHQSFIDAQYKLGYCYDHGIGVDINKETAFEFYKLAAENGNCDAKKSLAFLQDNEINNLISEKKP